MTRHDAKEKVQEWWGERGIFMRTALIFGIIGSVWLGVTAALNTVDDRYLLRREHNRYRDSVSAAAELRAVRDSSRQERVWRAIKYEGCMRRAKNDYRACELFNDKAQ